MTVLTFSVDSKVDFRRGQALVIVPGEGSCAIEDEDEQLLSTTSDSVDLSFEEPVKLRFVFCPGGEDRLVRDVFKLAIYRLPDEELTLLVVNDQVLEKLGAETESASVFLV